MGEMFIQEGVIFHPIGPAKNGRTPYVVYRHDAFDRPLFEGVQAGTDGKRLEIYVQKLPVAPEHVAGFIEAVRQQREALKPDDERNSFLREAEEAAVKEGRRQLDFYEAGEQKAKTALESAHSKAEKVRERFRRIGLLNE